MIYTLVIFVLLLSIFSKKLNYIAQGIGAFNNSAIKMLIYLLFFIYSIFVLYSARHIKSELLVNVLFLFIYLLFIPFFLAASHRRR
jgi:hypothetical protein